MADKQSAAYHGAVCAGECCRHNRHLGVCAHGRACQYHLDQDAQQARRDWTESSVLEIERAVQLASKRESARIEAWKHWR